MPERLYRGEKVPKGVKESDLIALNRANERLEAVKRLIPGLNESIDYAKQGPYNPLGQTFIKKEIESHDEWYLRN